MNNLYCIWIKTGEEDKYIEEMQPRLNANKYGFGGLFYFPKKKMRLKKGKEFIEPIFPGYVFLETQETDNVLLAELKNGSGFIKILPQTGKAQALSVQDRAIIETLVKFGSIIPIIKASFDVNDRIVLLDGPFKDIPGKIVAVNRRNKRVNIELEIMNGVRMVGLTYEEVKKV